VVERESTFHYASLGFSSHLKCIIITSSAGTFNLQKSIPPIIQTTRPTIHQSIGHFKNDTRQNRRGEKLGFDKVKTTIYMRNRKFKNYYVNVGG